MYDIAVQVHDRYIIRMEMTPNPKVRKTRKRRKRNEARRGPLPQHPRKPAAHQKSK
jgi:hypothetical protein